MAFKVRTLGQSFVLIAITIAMVACGGGGSDGSGDGDGGQGDSSGITVNEVFERIASSTEGDADNDLLPDDVERWLNMDPEDRDGDHDGMLDFPDLLGAEPYDGGSLLADIDGDGIIRALDQDDDGDGINDGEDVDSDGDGIPNYLEMYGFTYNWINDSYNLWDGQSFDQEYFKTDPLQRSSDQDPYADNTEVSWVNMDVSVLEPGSRPMVPAYPMIYVSLEGYQITLNEEITYTEGSSVARGSSWNQSTENTHSYTSEKNWEAGIEAEAKFPWSFGVKVHANMGGSTSTTDTTSHSKSSGGSILSQSDWSRATTSNPTRIADIKLFLKVHNLGTAVASNVIPTLTLRVGGHNVITFEPGNAQINLLEPGRSYPAEEGVYWVVDVFDTGNTVEEITLTLDELRALESGAPVSITTTQMLANVMQWDGESGAYVSVGDWNEYMARIRAVCAHLFLDLGDGNFVRSFVYADDSPASPEVTIADALAWLTGGTHDEQGRLIIPYTDRSTGLAKKAVLSGEDEEPWSLSIDKASYEANGFVRDEETGEWSAVDSGVTTTDLWGLRLAPASTIMIKAPASSVPGGDTPVITYAYYDPVTRGVYVATEDYSGIESVEFVDKNGYSFEMGSDAPGSGFYVFYPYRDLPGVGYTFDSTELVRVTNVNGTSVEQAFLEAYRPELHMPLIDKVRLDIDNGILTADVSWAGGELDTAPAWVRVYDPLFTATRFAADTAGLSYLPMHRVDDFYRKPDTWTVELPTGWTAVDQEVATMRIVAYGGYEDMFTEHIVSEEDWHLPYAEGSQELTAVGGPWLVGDDLWMVIYRDLFGVSLDTYYQIEGLDLDSSLAEEQKVSVKTGQYFSGALWQELNLSADVPQEEYPEVDFWLRYIDTIHNMAVYLPPGTGYVRYEPELGETPFAQLTPVDMMALESSMDWSGRYPADVNAYIRTDLPHDFVIKTVLGNYSKLSLTNPAWWRGYAYDLPYLNMRFDADFITFEPVVGAP